MTSTPFRILLVMSLILDIVASLIDEAFPKLLPIAAVQALDNEPLPSIFQVLSIFQISIIISLLFLIQLSAVVGLFFFRSWARPLAFCYTILMVVFYALSGSILWSNWTAAFSAASFYLWGAVLVLSYVSPVHKNFNVQ